MLKLTLEIDISGFERQVDDHMARAFQPAVVEALNTAGEAAVDAVWRGMTTSFDRPTPFTLGGVDYSKASVRTDGGDPSVLIYSIGGARLSSRPQPHPSGLPCMPT